MFTIIGKRRAFLVAVAAALFAAATAAYGQLKHVAVVETEVDPTAKITKAEAMEITAALRREAINNLTRGKYNIMTTETIQSMGGAVLEKCAEENCVISFGEMVGADYVVRGAVRKVGAKLSVTVEIHEIDHGMLVALSDPVMADKIEDLIEKAAAACAKMYKKFESEQAGGQKAPAVAVTYTITTAANPPNGGTVSRSPNQTSYAAGTTVSVTATPASGYTFTGWSGSSSSRNAVLTAPIDRDLTLTANFQYAQTKQTTVPTSTPTPTPAPTYPKSVVDGSGVLTDSRDGKRYKTVVIGKKTWMAQNLNHQPQSGQSWCYGDNNSNCNQYGRLYDWNTAKTVCPSGFHLPTRKEWDDLVTAVGGSSVAGKKLKARSGWYKKGDGTDDFYFSALPGGYYYGGSFYNVRSNGYWWTATGNDGSGSSAYIRDIGYRSDNVLEYYNGTSKTNGFSVRCVAD